MDVFEQGQIILKRAGFDPASQTNSHYQFDEGLEGVFLVTVRAVKPVDRAEAVRQLNEERSLDIAKGFALQEPIPPVEVLRLVETDGNYIYGLHHGYHRFNLSIAAGFTQIPARLVEALDRSTL